MLADFPPPTADPEPAVDPNLPRIRTDFECALQHPIRFDGGAGTPDDPYRYSVRFPSGRDQAGYFLFLLSGAEGSSVRFIFTTSRARNWASLNPVVHEVNDLDGLTPDEYLAQPDLFRSAHVPLDPSRRLVVGQNEVELARTQGVQQWHYLPDAARTAGNEFSFQLTPTQPHTFVAMRPPYTPQLTDAVVADLRGRMEDEEVGHRYDDIHLHRVGTSSQDRPLWLIQVGEDPPNRAGRKPVILLYAREHGDEHDSSWAVQGVLEYLTGPHRDAVAIRRRAIVLIVPMLDPDCAATNVYEGFIRTFDDNRATPESMAWAHWFRDWADAGHRLDLVLNVHNVESGEGPHLFPAQYPGRGNRAEAADHLARTVHREVTHMGYASRHGAGSGHSSDRLAGWLDRTFGAFHLPYEVNSQSADRHLSLYELKALGVHLLRGSVRHLTTQASRPLVAAVERDRRNRLARWERYGQLDRVFLPWLNVFELEQVCRTMPGVEASLRADGLQPAWIAPLYTDTPSGTRNR
jgi:hypothetical protein